MITARELLDVDNPSARKFWAMGFRLSSLDMLKTLDSDEIWAARAHFRCACGREEVFQQILPPPHMLGRNQFASDHHNVYRCLDQGGSMDRDHLLADGYAPEVVDQMLERGQDEILGAMMAGAALTQMSFTDTSMWLSMPNHAEVYAMMLGYRKPRPMPRNLHPVMRFNDRPWT